MSHLRLLRRLPAALLALGTMAQAASEGAAAAGPKRTSPLDARAAVPPASHESAFSQYRPQREEPLRSWKDANENVGRIGGWRSYAREASQANAPTAPVSADKPAGAEPPKPAGHGGHKSN